MSYVKSLSFDNVDNLYLCLLSEKASLSNNRASCCFELKGNKVVFDVEAKDETAFNAILSSINKLVIIHKKTKNLIKTIS